MASFEVGRYYREEAKHGGLSPSLAVIKVTHIDSDKGWIHYRLVDGDLGLTEGRFKFRPTSLMASMLRIARDYDPKYKIEKELERILK